MRNKRTLIITAAAAGSALVAAGAIFGTGAEFHGLPKRVTDLEKSQVELVRRVDSVDAKLGAIQRDVEVYARRTDENMAQLNNALAGISGKLQDLRESAAANFQLTARANEKAISAATRADEAISKTAEMEGRLKPK